MARGRARRKISELRALLGSAEFFTPKHAVLLQSMLARIDQISAEIGSLTQVCFAVRAEPAKTFIACDHVVCL